MLSNLLFRKFLSVGLRVTSLGAKLILTLYMGRYLGLHDLGVYGLVFGAVMISTVILGARLDYAVARELVGARTLDVLCKLRDQTVFLFYNYLLFAIVIAFLAVIGVATSKLLFIIFVISILESLANTYTTNLTSMGWPVLSTFLFFIRAGLWCFAVVLLGVLEPSLRTVQIVLIGWGVGEALSLLINVWVWRKLPWHDVFKVPVDWDWIKRLFKQCFPIWMGTLGTASALMVDRFVVSYFMDMKDVGVITFYGSFATALLALVQSGFYSFSYPKLIKHYRQNETDSFWQEARQVGWQVALFMAASGIALGLLIPFSAPFFQKPELGEHAFTLWLMLFAVWVRSNADTLYYVLYARHQDWALWVGSLLFLIPALCGNLVLVPLYGLAGVGYSAVLASFFLVFWRGAYALSGK